MKPETDHNMISLLRGIKKLWDETGLGHDAAESERLYKQMTRILATDESKPERSPTTTSPADEGITAAKQDVYYAKCPQCDGASYSILKGDIKKCSHCEAVYGVATSFAESHQFVLPQFASGEVPHEQTRYYDMMILLPNGQCERRHGWFDPATRRITQVG